LELANKIHFQGGSYRGIWQWCFPERRSSRAWL